MRLDPSRERGNHFSTGSSSERIRAAARSPRRGVGLLRDHWQVETDKRLVRRRIAPAWLTKRALPLLARRCGYRNFYWTTGSRSSISDQARVSLGYRRCPRGVFDKDSIYIIYKYKYKYRYVARYIEIYMSRRKRNGKQELNREGESTSIHTIKHCQSRYL